MKNLQRRENHDILELKTEPVIRLEVGGRFVGEVNVLTGHIMLYHRGQKTWVSLAEERRRLGLTED